MNVLCTYVRTYVCMQGVGVSTYVYTVYTVCRRVSEIMSSSTYVCVRICTVSLYCTVY